MRGYDVVPAGTCWVCGSKEDAPLAVRSFGHGNGAGKSCQACIDVDAQPMWLIWRELHQGNRPWQKLALKTDYERSLPRYLVNFSQSQIDSIFECESWTTVCTSLRGM